jgi:lipid-A-disaccharide synthase
VGVLNDRGNEFSVIVPTLPKLRETIESAAANWPVHPHIVTGEDEKWAAFAAADAALAASGTVTLELALAGVPMISCYRTDWMVRAARRLITVWSGVLPNLIADGRSCLNTTTNICARSVWRAR